MSSDPALILEVTPPGSGIVLDLGGGRGYFKDPLRRLGYSYVNLDLRRWGQGEPSVIGDSHRLPLRSEGVDLVVSKDTLEHFLRPWEVLSEVYRVLKPGGLFIVWIPFMHPFHGDDFYRYSPLALRHLFREFEIMLFDSPLWIFSVMSMAVGELFRRIHLDFLPPVLKKVAYHLDRRFTRGLSRPSGFAAGYRLVARKRGLAAS